MGPAVPSAASATFLSANAVSPAEPGPSRRDRIVDALMALAAEQPFGEISMSAVAQRAGVSLADFRDLFPSKGAVIGAFSRRIDRIVLEGATADLADESDKERLFDVLMRRIDAMAPYRPALASIAEWAKRDPFAAAALNGMALNSMRFMIEAAGLNAEGPLGPLKLQGLVVLWTRTMAVWLGDDEEGCPATMAELDRGLQRGQTLIARADDLGRLAAPLTHAADLLRESGQRWRARAARRTHDAAAPDPDR